MAKTEEWKWVIGHPGKYLVSSHGRVQSFCKKPNGAFLVQTRAPNGYLFVSIGGWCAVHVLVCRHFKGEKPTPKHEVAHRDGVRSNNKSTNLSWKTRSQNNRDQDRHGTRVRAKGERNGHAVLSKRQVLAILKKSAAGVGAVALSKEYEVTHGTIGHIINGRNWTHITGKKRHRG